MRTLLNWKIFYYHFKGIINNQGDIDDYKLPSVIYNYKNDKMW